MEQIKQSGPEQFPGKCRELEETPVPDPQLSDHILKEEVVWQLALQSFYCIQEGMPPYGRIQMK